METHDIPSKELVDRLYQQWMIAEAEDDEKVVVIKSPLRRTKQTERPAPVRRLSANMHALHERFEKK